jgi:hypothetical protein
MRTPVFGAVDWGLPISKRNPFAVASYRLGRLLHKHRTTNLLSYSFISTIATVILIFCVEFPSIRVVRCQREYRADAVSAASHALS